MIFICRECNGYGELFAGAEMRPNPYDYSDYNEIWLPCHRCGGKGKTWLPPWYVWLNELKYRIHHFKETP